MQPKSHLVREACKKKYILFCLNVSAFNQLLLWDCLESVMIGTSEINYRWKYNYILEGHSIPGQAQWKERESDASLPQSSSNSEWGVGSPWHKIRKWLRLSGWIKIFKHKYASRARFSLIIAWEGYYQPQQNKPINTMNQLLMGASPEKTESQGNPDAFQQERSGSVLCMPESCVEPLKIQIPQPPLDPLAFP